MVTETKVNVTQTIKSVIDLLQLFYESPSLANTRALVLIDNELPALRQALIQLESNQQP